MNFFQTVLVAFAYVCLEGSTVLGIVIKAISGPGIGKCIGYDHWGDLYLKACTSGSEQSFRLGAGGCLFAEGGPKANQCVLADGWFWPKLRPCNRNDAKQQWIFSGGKIVTDGGTKCLRLDPTWSDSRLKVEECDNDDYDQIWSVNPAPIIVAGPQSDGSGKCVGYDHWGDLYLYGCTNRREQMFLLDGSRLVAQGGAKAGQCLLADNGFWPKLRVCDDSNNQKWKYAGGKFVCGDRCLRYDPNWVTYKRLKVENCNNVKYDQIWSWNGHPMEVKGRCIGYDHWGDLYVYGCTGRTEQQFTLDSDGRIVSQGGAKTFQCVYADQWFWPKLRPCNNDARQQWKYEGSKITTAKGTKCLRLDPSWSGSRLKVEDCNNASMDSIWF